MLPCACRALPLVLRAVYLVCLCILALQLTSFISGGRSLCFLSSTCSGIGSFALAFAPLPS